MSLLNHVSWPSIRPYIKIQIYAPDGGARRPRRRLEFHEMPDSLRAELLSVECPCVSCGRKIHPIRERHPIGKSRGQAKSALYLAVACPLDVNIGCSRGAAASAEYKAIEEAITKD